MKPTCESVTNHIKHLWHYYILRLFIWIVWTISIIVIWNVWANQYFTSQINHKISIIIACVWISLPWLRFKLWRPLTNRYY